MFPVRQGPGRHKETDGRQLMGKAVEAIAAAFVFIVFLYVMYTMHITLSDVITYFRNFFGFSILAAANSKAKKKLRNRFEELLRSRMMRGIMAVIPRRSR